MREREGEGEGDECERKTRESVCVFRSTECELYFYRLYSYINTRNV
jgi:hypothetical protein